MCQETMLRLPAIDIAPTDLWPTVRLRGWERWRPHAVSAPNRTWTPGETPDWRDVSCQGCSEDALSCRLTIHTRTLRAVHGQA